MNGGRADTHRRKIVLVGVEGNLRIVLVCEAEERRQGLDTVNGRVTDWVDKLEEYLECLQRVVNVDDRDLRRSIKWLGNREHISEHRRHER